MYKEMLEKMKELAVKIDNEQSRRAKNKLIDEYRNIYISEGFNWESASDLVKKIGENTYLRLDLKTLEIKEITVKAR